MRVALVTTPPDSGPGQLSGTAEYVHELLPYLREHVDLDVFVEAGREGELEGSIAVDELRPKRYDQLVYQLANEPAHAFMLPMIRVLGGTVVLHDWILSDLALAAHPHLANGGLRGRLLALREGGLSEARRFGRAGSNRFDFSLNRSVVRHGDAFIVHSRHLKQRILRERNQLTPVAICPHGAERRWRDTDRRASRAELGLPESMREGFLLVGPGPLRDNRRIVSLLEALAALNEQGQGQGEGPRLALLGRELPGEVDVGAACSRLGLEASVHLTGPLGREGVRDWLHAADACISLRGPSTGGLPDDLFAALSLARAVVTSDCPEHAGLDGDFLVRVPAGEGDDEVRELCRVLGELHSDRGRIETMERAAREFVESEAHWGHVAALYASFLEDFPPAHSARKPLVVSLMRASARRRREAAAAKGEV